MKQLLLLLLSSACFATSEPLSKLVEHNTRPWLQHEANSEQRHPYYIGASPRMIEIEGKKFARAELSEKLRTVGTAQLLKITKGLGNDLEVEAWPYLNDDGDPAWAFARWKVTGSETWNWFVGKENGRGTFENPPAALPIVFRPWVAAERKKIFLDFLKLDSLYDKPCFGDAVWTSLDGQKVVSGWLDLKTIEEKEKAFSAGKDVVARILPQPARFNSQPITFIVQVKKDKVTWPSDIDWKPIPEVQVVSKPLKFNLSFPSTYSSEFKKWLDTFSGENSEFTKRNSADPENELELVADYLQEQYRLLGIQVKRQTFQYRGRPQSNLTAIIPGSLSGKANRPVLFADHYDTAFAEDTFEKTGKRVANPGANDNTTATASLLMAAKILKSTKPKHDIWFVHLTGEEYPSDDLGARHFLGELLKNKQDINGLVLIDLIGYRKSGDKVFQINLGGTTDSLRLGQVALAASEKHATKLTPKIRGRFDELSYLYNTDGYIFNNLGYPVVYFNEHLNRKNMSSTNPFYHQSTDVPSNIDLDYAVPISQAAIATVWELANLE